MDCDYKGKGMQRLEELVGGDCFMIAESASVFMVADTATVNEEVTVFTQGAILVIELGWGVLSTMSIVSRVVRVFPSDGKMVFVDECCN